MRGPCKLNQAKTTSKCNTFDTHHHPYLSKALDYTGGSYGGNDCPENIEHYLILFSLRSALKLNIKFARFLVALAISHARSAYIRPSHTFRVISFNPLRLLDIPPPWFACACVFGAIAHIVRASDCLFGSPLSVDRGAWSISFLDPCGKNV